MADCQLLKRILLCDIFFLVAAFAAAVAAVINYSLHLSLCATLCVTHVCVCVCVMACVVRPNMTQEEAEKFVVEALALAMARDASSGGVIRTVTLDKDGPKFR